MDTLKDIQNAYESFIVEHPEVIGGSQKAVKWLDFVISARDLTARKLSKMIYHLMKDFNVQIPTRPQHSQENISKDMETYTLKDILNVCKAWIAEHPKEFEDLKKILILLAFSKAGEGAAPSKVVLSRIIYRLVLDYNNRIIKRSRESNISATTLQSKL